MSRASTRQPVLLQDYRPPAFLTPRVELEFVLEPEATLVTARQRFERQPGLIQPRLGAPCFPALSGIRGPRDLVDVAADPVQLPRNRPQFLALTIRLLRRRAQA